MVAGRKQGMHSHALIPFSINVLALAVAFGLAGAGIQEQGAIFAVPGEIKHLRDRVGNSVERALADASSAEPIIFDEADDRRLIGHDMVDEVSACPGRD